MCELNMLKFKKTYLRRVKEIKTNQKRKYYVISGNKCCGGSGYQIYYM